jgi:hypothetical protein
MADVETPAAHIKAADTITALDRRDRRWFAIVRDAGMDDRLKDLAVASMD